MKGKLIIQHLKKKSFLFCFQVFSMSVCHMLPFLTCKTLLFMWKWLIIVRYQFVKRILAKEKKCFIKTINSGGFFKLGPSDVRVRFCKALHWTMSISDLHQKHSQVTNIFCFIQLNGQPVRCFCPLLIWILMSAAMLLIWRHLTEESLLLTDPPPHCKR